jgi:hypothetical protein
MLRNQTKDPFKLFSFISKSEFEGEDGAGSPAPEATPVVETPEQIEAGIAAALAGDTPIEPSEPVVKTELGAEPVVKTEPVVTKTEPAPPADTYTPNTIWDTIKSSYEKEVGEGKFVMPEGVNAENEHEKLIEFLRNNIEPDVSGFHPFVQEVIKAASAEDFDPATFVQQKVQSKSYLDLPSEEFMKLHLKNYSEREKKGWTDEDIENHIKGKDKIALDAEVTDLKGRYREYETQNAEVQKAEKIKLAEAQYDKIIEDRNNKINTLIERNKTVNDYFGITFGEAELKDFHTWLPEMLKVSKESGTYPLADYLQSDDNLMKIAAVVYKTEKGMRDYLSDLKEGVKSDLMAKLRITPENDGGTIAKTGGAQPITGFEQNS